MTISYVAVVRANPFSRIVVPSACVCGLECDKMHSNLLHYNEKVERGKNKKERIVVSDL